MSSRKLNPNALPADPPPVLLRESLVTHYPDFSRAQTTTDAAYTTSGAVGWETIAATSSSSRTISLVASPKAGQRVSVVRVGSGAVTIDTDGSETINGSASVSLASQWDTKTFEAIDTGSGVEYVEI